MLFDIAPRPVSSIEEAPLVVPPEAAGLHLDDVFAEMPARLRRRHGVSFMRHSLSGIETPSFSASISSGWRYLDGQATFEAFLKLNTIRLKPWEATACKIVAAGELERLVQIKAPVRFISENPGRFTFVEEENWMFRKDRQGYVEITCRMPAGVEAEYVVWLTQDFKTKIRVDED